MKTVNTADALIDEEFIAAEYESTRKLIRNSQIYLYMIGVFSIITVVSTLILSTYVNRPPNMLNMVSDAAGTVESVYPVINPQVTDKQAILWANDATSELLSLHFKKYNEQLAFRKRLFVGGGWELYRQSLIENNVIESIIEKGLVITAGNAETPRLYDKRKVDGKVNWYLEIPVFQTVVGARDGAITVKKKVYITVQETRRDEALDGLKIRLFNIQQ